MKKWQLMAIIADEKYLLKDFMDNNAFDYQSILPTPLIHKYLSQINKYYIVISNNYLRLAPLPPVLIELGLYTVETIPVLDAYERYGADAITEVIDYGSYNLS